MLSYPSILGSAASPLGKPCFGFYKYDGSNLRWEYSPKRGWYKQGLRHTLFDASDLRFRDAIPIWQEQSQALLKNIQKNYRGFHSLVAFTEFFGLHSFAGNHIPGESKELRLFDLAIDGKFLTPKEFIALTKQLPFSAELIYTGNLNRELVKKVQDNTLENIALIEGIVCKNNLWMAKIKTRTWLERLKSQHPDMYKTENEYLIEEFPKNTISKGLTL